MESGDTLANASAGTIVVSGGLTVTSALSTATASSTGLVKANSLNVGGSGTNINSVVYGYCTISDSAAITASSTAFFSCAGATGITSAFRVFIQATSSLATNLYVQSASTTATAGTISLQIYNQGYAGSLAPGDISFNFMGIR